MPLHRLARAGLFVLAIPLVFALWNAAHVALRLAPGGVAALAADAFATAAVLALLAGAGAALSREGPTARLGLRAGRMGGGTMALAAIGLLGLSHAVEGLVSIAGIAESATLARFAATLADAGAGELLLAVLAFTLGSAVAEELLFRGLVQRGLEGVVGAAGAIGVTALAFGAAHADLVHAAAALPLGIYLGVLAWLDGSIRPALVAHAANNAVAVLEAGAGFRLPEGGLLALASIGVGLAIAAYGLRAAVRCAAPHRAEASPPPAPLP